ncbi:MAG TPA: tetratricopeptide repeat protein [Candidatus Nitrosocosmicus sp.]|nr:tetratricopeptide repeat protein [Candidatus Nitrosocosmicus sp.]
MFKTIASFMGKTKKIDKRNRDSTQSKLTDKQTYLEELVKHGEWEASKNKLEDALKTFDFVIREDPKCDIAYGDKALILEKMGRLDESLDLSSKALEINPKNTVVWHNRGLTLVKKKLYDDAIICFDKAISLEVNYAKAWYNKGRCLEMQEQPVNAQVCLTQARKLDPFLFSKIKFRS